MDWPSAFLLSTVVVCGSGIGFFLWASSAFGRGLRAITQKAIDDEMKAQRAKDASKDDEE